MKRAAVFLAWVCSGRESDVGRRFIPNLADHRLVARRLVAELTHQDGCNCAFYADTGGTPYGRLKCGRWLSATHADGLVAVALSRDLKVGVDIERLRSLRLPGPFREGMSERQLRCWTQHEALYKAQDRSDTFLFDYQTALTQDLANRSDGDRTGTRVSTEKIAGKYILSIAVSDPEGDVSYSWH